MIGPIHPIRAPMASGAAPPPCSDVTPTDASRAPAVRVGTAPSGEQPATADPILCGHCGRTASNGISCQGMCVADSGY
jgi:hypothetical protein